MTNNQTIDGVPREDERHAAVKVLHDVMQSVPSASLYSLAEAVLDAGYAPVVERQEPVAWLDIESGALVTDKLKPLLDGFDVPLFRVLPELAALQSRIDQLEAEAMYAAATYQAARERIEELESGRGEPVAWRFRVSSGGDWFTTTKQGVADLYRGTKDGGEVEPLFTAPPAPVTAVLPDRGAFEQSIIERDGSIWVTVFGDVRSYNEPIERDYSVWQACLDATAALNGVRK